MNQEVQTMIMNLLSHLQICRSIGVMNLGLGGIRIRRASRYRGGVTSQMKLPIRVLIRIKMTLFYHQDHRAQTWRRMRRSRRTCRSCHNVSGCAFNLKNLKLYVVRRNSLDEMCNSAPCMHCTEILKLCNIKHIIYSNKEGELEKYKMKEYENSHISLGYRSINKTIV